MTEVEVVEAVNAISKDFCSVFGFVIHHEGMQIKKKVFAENFT